MQCNARSIIISIFVAGMLITGTLNTIAANSQNKTTSIGIDGFLKPFKHPFVQTFLMFLGEASCLIALSVFNCYQDRKHNDSATIQYRKKRPKVCGPSFALPMLCDLCATTLGGIGLLYIQSSVWQMLRGSRIVFSSILTLLFLPRKLYLFNAFGIFVVTSGLALVGVSQYLSSGAEKKNVSDLVLGIVVTLVGQLFSATQMVVEEKFVKDKNYPPLNIVGMEGLWGVVVTGGIVLPSVYFVPRGVSPLVTSFSDDVLDAVVQIRNNWILVIFVFSYILSIAFFNFFGVALTKELSAIHRTILDTLRTITIWVVELFIYYALKLPTYGEDWDDWSYLQAGGFMLLVIGTLIYNKILKVPFMFYPKEAEEPLDITTTLLNPQINISSLE
eukprot:TRINITY_DN4571_c0_g1_i1.p1 TRINITY_DN4571_c0_g1~~TRINITY_DN4571_c0_g1_i1.p1  ORF type:complete len:388 (+),score=56.82 TRINITY_DN4571_c0_g1_i1:11-1174(+)